MSAAFHRRVHRELARLENAGVIDARASLLIGERYPTSGWDLVMLVRVFTIAGAIAAGAGAVLLAKDLSNALRLLEAALLVATVLLIVAAGWVTQSKGLPRAGAALEMLAGFALQGLTTAIAIDFSTGSKNWPALVGIQTILLVALAYALDNRLVLAHACVTMFVWFGGETGYVSGWGMYWLGMSYPLRFLGAGFVALGIAWIHAEWMEKYQHFSRVYAHFGALTVQLSLWFLSVFGNFGNPGTIRWGNEGERLAYTALWAGVASGFVLMGARLGAGILRAYGLVFLIINAYTFYFQFLVVRTGEAWWIHLLLTGTSLFFVGTWLERRLRGAS
jgi:hypothetical protein